MPIEPQPRIRDFAILTLAVGLCNTASADVGFNAIGDVFSYSGFGTAAVARSDTNDAEFVNHGQNSGATENFDYKSDSKFGLQGTVAPTTWLSGTVQMLSEERGTDHISTEIEWAFLKLTPLPGLSIRGGQMAIPTYLVSDSRNVGYTNTWLRAPDEVYGQATFDTYRGFDLSYQHAVGNCTLTVSALEGSTSIDVLLGPGLVADMVGHRLRGYSASLDTGDLAIRASRISTALDINFMGYPITSAFYTFDSLGVTYSHQNVVAQAEFIEARAGVNVAYNVNGWYGLGGYRLGKWLPYGIYAGGMQPSAAGGSIPQYNRYTVSAGVRYDVSSSIDVKAQFDHVKAYATGSPYINFVNIQPDWNHQADIVSLAVDFVF